MTLNGGEPATVPNNPQGKWLSCKEMRSSKSCKEVRGLCISTCRLINSQQFYSKSIQVHSRLTVPNSLAIIALQSQRLLLQSSVVQCVDLEGCC